MLSITKYDFMNIELPLRYLGEECGIIVKTKEKKYTGVAICYPNLYDIGMNDYIFLYLYSLLNNEKGTYCKRCFLPYSDFENLLKNKKEKLYTLEDKMPLSECQIYIFVISNIFEYVNIFAMMKLGNIKRKSNNLFIGIIKDEIKYEIAGLLYIFDCIIIGEYEKVCKDVLFRYNIYISQNLKKDDLLESISKIKGVFVKGLNDKIELGYIKNNEFKSLSFKYNIPISNISTINQKIIVEFSKDNDRIKDIKLAFNETLEFIKSTRIINVEVKIGNLTEYSKLIEYIDMIKSKNPLINIYIPNLKFNKDTLKIYIKTEMIKSSVVFDYYDVNEGLENVKLAFENNANDICLNAYIGDMNENYNDLDRIVKYVTKIKEIFYNLSAIRRKQNLNIKLNIKNICGYLTEKNVNIIREHLELKQKYLDKKINEISNVICDYEPLEIFDIKYELQKANAIKFIEKAYDSGFRYYG